MPDEIDLDDDEEAAINRAWEQIEKSWRNDGTHKGDSRGQGPSGKDAAPAPRDVAKRLKKKKNPKDERS